MSSPIRKIRSCIHEFIARQRQFFAFSALHFSFSFTPNPNLFLILPCALQLTISLVLSISSLLSTSICLFSYFLPPSLDLSLLLTFLLPPPFSRFSLHLPRPSSMPLSFPFRSRFICRSFALIRWLSIRTC